MIHKFTEHSPNKMMFFGLTLLILVTTSQALSLYDQEFDYIQTVATTDSMDEDYEYTISTRYNITASCGGTSRFRYRIIGSEGGTTNWKEIDSVTDNGYCGDDGWGGYTHSETSKEAYSSFKENLAEEEKIQLHFSGDSLKIYYANSDKEKLPDKTGGSYTETIDQRSVSNGRKALIDAEALIDNSDAQAFGDYKLTVNSCGDTSSSKILYRKVGTRGGIGQKNTIDSLKHTSTSDSSWGPGCESKSKEGSYQESLNINEGEHLQIVGVASPGAEGSAEASVIDSKAVLNADSLSPSTSDDSDNLWHNNSQNIKLTCTDSNGGSGCDKTYYCTDQSNQCNPDNQGKNVKIENNGVNYLRYYSTDNKGNKENIQETKVKIDGEKPSVELEKIQKDTDLIANLTCSDSISKCKSGSERMKTFKPGEQPDKCPKNYKEYNIENKSKKIRDNLYICGTARDKANNTNFTKNPVFFEGELGWDGVSILSISPEDQGYTDKSPVELSIRLNASSIDDKEVYGFFYNENSTLIGKDSGTGKELTLSQDWGSTRVGERYRWYMKIGDKEKNFTTSTYSFTKGMETDYRIDTNIDHPYSQIIAQKGVEKTVFLEVENRVSNPKELTTYVEGLNATFPNNGENVNYSLRGEESKRLRIRIRGSKTGKSYLRITTENKDANIRTDNLVPVYVKEIPALKASEVPGIGLPQILTLVLISIIIRIFSVKENIN